jgi:hypothetical protein
MRSLDVTVLLHEGPQARAYLSLLRRSGLRPERLVLVLEENHAVTGRPLGRWLPRWLRTPYVERVQDLTRNHWPRALRRDHPELLDAILEGMQERVPGAAEIVSEITGAFRYETYARRVDRVFAQGVSDIPVERALAGAGAVLFTGGGLIRSNILRLPSVRLLHVHPGRLPELRGADGVLWSETLRDEVGMSCFYMEEGLDAGPLVATASLPPLRFDLKRRPRPEGQTLYRALFSFVDPLLRARFLTDLIQRAGGPLADLPASAQDPTAGVVQHFMHPRLRDRALGRIFAS